MIRALLTRRPEQLRFGNSLQLFFLILLCLIPSLVQAEQRTWTSADGKNQVRGELLGTTDKVVILKKQSDGTLHVVPFSMLSGPDQDYVRKKYPQIFPEEKNKPAQSTPTAEPASTSPEMKTEQTSRSENDPQNNRFNWEQVSRVLPQFQTMLVDGSPVITSNAQIVAPKGQMHVQHSADFTGAILCYLADRDAYELLAEKLEEKGFEGAFNATTGAEKERIVECFWLFENLYELFYSKQEMRQYSELRRSGLNDFDKGIQVARYVRKLHQDFQKLNYQDEEIPVSLFMDASLNNYNEGIGEFPLTIRGTLRWTVIGGRYNKINAIFVNSPAIPKGIQKTLDEARVFARQIEGKRLAFREDLILTRPRFEQNPSLRTPDKIRLINAKIVGLSLVDAANPSQVLQKWDLEQPVEPVPHQPVTGKQGLAQKMQSLARQHQLELFGEYPAIRVDDIRFTSKGPVLSSDPYRFSKLLDRVALGLDPDFVCPTFIAHHFPETIGGYVSAGLDNQGAISSAQWLGNNEFDKRSNQKRFQQEYAEKLKAYVVSLPLRFVEIQKVQLGYQGRYDFERQGAFINHSLVNGHFPALNSNTYYSREKEMDRRYSPFFVQQFLPLTTEQARLLFSQAEDGYNPAYVARVVTWDQLPLARENEQKIPPVLVTTESCDLYRDPLLKQHIASLECKKIPPPFLSDAKGKVLPGPDQPFDLNQEVLYFLKQEADGVQADSGELEKLFSNYSYQPQSYAGDVRDALEELRKAEETYSSIGTARDGYPSFNVEGKQRIIQNWKEARQKVDQLFKHSRSSFFPVEIGEKRLDEKQLPELREKWKQWMVSCIDSTKRNFIINAEIRLDRQLGDVQMTLSHESLLNPYTWEPAKPLIDKGVPADCLVILNYQNPQIPYTHIPCLQLQQPLSQTFDQIPKDVRDLIKDRMSYTARLEMLVSLDKPTLLPHPTAGYQPGLLFPTKLKGIRLYNDKTLIYETPLPAAGNNNGVDQSASVSKSQTVKPSEMKAAPADPDKLERFTPATAMRLMARYLPEFVKENGETLMYNRWLHETDFRKYGEQSPYGLNAERPVYFRSQIKSLPREQIKAETPTFVKWLCQPETYPGDRFTVQFSTKFHPYSKVVEGYRRDLISGRDIDETSNHGKLKSSINSEISLLERRIKTEAFMQQNYPDRPKSGGGGGVGGGLYIGTPNNGTTPVKEKSKQKGGQPSAKSLQYQKEIEALTRLKHYVEWASPVFYLHQVNKKFGFIELPGKPNQNYSLEHVPPSGDSQPILTVLNLSHQIVMPNTDGFYPGHQKWPVELEFETKAARAQDKPPKKYEVEEWGEGIRELKDPLDFGRYVVFDVEVKEAWLLDRQTGKRLHQMKLIPVKQMKQAREKQK